MTENVVFPVCDQLPKFSFLVPRPPKSLEYLKMLNFPIFYLIQRALNHYSSIIFC